MTKFAEKSFSVGLGGQKYRDNWENVFGKKPSKPNPWYTNVKNIDVIIYTKDDATIFNCVDYDIAGSGKDLEEAKQNFINTFSSHIINDYKQNQEFLKNTPSTSDIFKEMFTSLSSGFLSKFDFNVYSDDSVVLTINCRCGRYNPTTIIRKKVSKKNAKK